LIAWEDDKIARQSQDLLGPSTRAAIHALRDGADAAEVGRNGTTNGAAMRIAPVGIAHAPGNGLFAAVANVCRLTHNTTVAIDAAALVAGVISAGIDGADVITALDQALAAASSTDSSGHWADGALASRRFATLRPLVDDLPEAAFIDFLRHVVGTSVASQEAVTAALLLVQRFRQQPFAGLCCAAMLGGDTDTIAAIAGAMFGACLG